MSGGCEVLIRLYTMAQRNGGALQHQSIFSVMLYENSDIECLYMMWGVFFSSHSLKTSLQCDSRNRVENYFGPVPTFSLSPVPVIRLSSIVSLWLIHIAREWCRSFVPDPFYRSGSFFFFFFFKKPALHFSQPGAHSYSALHWSPQAWVAISNY